MKKILTATAIILAPFFLSAQGDYSFRFSDKHFEIVATIFVVYLIITFILSLIRTLLDSRLKSKMVDKGVSDTIVQQFLQPRSRDAKTQAIKSFLVLLAIAVGLTIINYTLPLGIHSIAIMAFSISFGFLGYFFYLRQSGNSY
jgi:hypothetical protein